MTNLLIRDLQKAVGAVAARATSRIDIDKLAQSAAEELTTAIRGNKFYSANSQGGPNENDGPVWYQFITINKTEQRVLQNDCQNPSLVNEFSEKLLAELKRRNPGINIAYARIDSVPGGKPELYVKAGMFPRRADSNHILRYAAAHGLPLPSGFGVAPRTPSDLERLGLIEALCPEAWEYGKTAPLIPKAPPTGTFGQPVDLATEV